MEIRSLADLVAAAREAESAFAAAQKRVGRSRISRTVWYRGEAEHRADWRLSPKTCRAGQSRNEKALLLQFQMQAVSRHAATPQPDSLARWMCLAQHYGLPTRLLDWTESVLVAAFFAVTGEQQKQRPSRIWALCPTELNSHFVGDPSFFLLEGPHAMRLVKQAFGFALNKDEKNFVTRAQALAVKVPEIDPRIAVQQSVFTIHASRYPVDKPSVLADEAFLKRFLIPCESRPIIAEELRIAGIRSSTIFPDLEHLAKDLAGT